MAAEHEVAAHGDLHTRVVKLVLAQELETHRRGAATLCEVSGAPPRGY